MSLRRLSTAPSKPLHAPCSVLMRVRCQDVNLLDLPGCRSRATRHSRLEPRLPATNLSARTDPLCWPSGTLVPIRANCRYCSIQVNSEIQILPVEHFRSKSLFRCLRRIKLQAYRPKSTADLSFSDLFAPPETHRYLGPDLNKSKISGYLCIRHMDPDRPQFSAI